MVLYQGPLSTFRGKLNADVQIGLEVQKLLCLFKIDLERRVLYPQEQACGRILSLAYDAEDNKFVTSLGQ